MTLLQWISPSGSTPGGYFLEQPTPRCIMEAKASGQSAMLIIRGILIGLTVAALSGAGAAAAKEAMTPLERAVDHAKRSN